MRVSIALGLLAAMLFGVGCSKPSTSTSGVSTAGAKYVLASEPDGALPVGEARKQVSTDVEVTVVGLIGGSSEPFVDGMAAFTIVDVKVPYCADEEGCPTPWDYCCQTDAVKDNIATVKIVDENGNLVMQDARKLLNAKELAKVTVQGIAKRDDHGNLAIHATKLFVQKGK